MLELDHAELSCLAMSRWELAEPVRWAATYHYEPERAHPLTLTAPDRVPLCLAVHQADALANFLGMSVLPPQLGNAEMPNLAFEGHPYNRDRLLQRFELEWRSIVDLFQ